MRITILRDHIQRPAYTRQAENIVILAQFLYWIVLAGVLHTQHHAKQKRAYRPLLHTSVQITDIYINAPWDGLSFLIRHAHADAFPVAQVILHEAQRLAEPLEVDDFPFAQEP